MGRDTDRIRSLTRRALVLGGVKLGLFGVLGGRMHYLQVTEGERYRLLAEENRINLRLIAPSRGQILDRFGAMLATNNQNFRVVLVAEQAGDVEATLGKLSDIVPLTAADIGRVIRDIARRRRFVPVTVRENLSWEQVSRIEVHTPELPGLSIDVGESRNYPLGEAAAHILGYVGAVSEAELTGDPVLTLPGFRIGKAGVERQHDPLLRGNAGASRVEVNAYGRVIRELDRTEGTPGRDVQLTLDIGLQEFVQQRLSTELGASAVIMDVHNGEVYAMASQPSFDPNLFATGIDAETWQALSTDPFGPLGNKVIAGQYAPGSTFKMMVALAALEDGMSPTHAMYCPGHLDMGNHRFHCWRRGGHGTMNMIEALSQSCDVYFYDVARRIGVDKIAAMADRFSIGRRTEIDLPGEAPGLMPTRAWKQATLGSTWQPGETLVVSIGQGYMLTTPLQLAVMTARMVNGGKVVQPHVTLRQGGPGQPIIMPETPSIGVSARALGIVTQGMIHVTSSPTGTARSAQIREPGMQMGGKTGTSQVRRITMAERATGVLRNEQLPWRQRDHALFVAFAPVHAPRYAAAVVVEHGGGGSRVAAPIARDILTECQRRNPAGRVVAGSAQAAPPGVLGTIPGGGQTSDRRSSGG